jgi:hypothetical protein
LVARQVEIQLHQTTLGALQAVGVTVCGPSARALSTISLKRFWAFCNARHLCAWKRTGQPWKLWQRLTEGCRNEKVDYDQASLMRQLVLIWLFRLLQRQPTQMLH